MKPVPSIDPEVTPTIAGRNSSNISRNSPVASCKGVGVEVGVGVGEGVGVGVGVGGSGVAVAVGDAVGSAGIGVAVSSVIRLQPITSKAAVITPMATRRPK